MEDTDRKRKKWLLSDIILGWSIDAITNENLLKDKVKKIPREFASLRHYFESFQYPFIEEVRAQLSLKLVSLCESPSVEILIEADSRFTHEISFKWLSSDAGHKGVYVPSVGDVILLSNVIVKDVLELKEGSTHHCIGFIYEVTKGDSVFCKANLGAIDNKVKFSGDGSRTFMAYFLMNIAKMSCTWESLNEENDDNCDLIKKALWFESLVEKSCSCSAVRIEEVLDDKLVKKLNESQVDAIHSVISSIRCCHAFSIHEISGLPGTGKTEIVSIIAFVAMTLKCKAIVCSPTIFSAAEVASRFLKFVRQFHTNTNLEEVVLLQDNYGEKVVITSDLTDICMENRILLLKDCFSLDHGWRHHITLMVSLLENFPVQRRDFLVKHKTTKNGFMEFIRARYDSVAFPLKNCIKLMRKNLPKSFFSVYETQMIVSLVNLIDSFRGIISNYSSGCLEEMFLRLEVAKRDIGTSEGILSDNLWRTRNQLLDMLCLLRNTLRIPTESELVTLLLAQCHIIFCTTSSLSKLDSLGVRGPFDLLIIDNAVQLKECDSVVSLKLNGLRHLLLSGSDYELPPKVLSKVSECVGFGRSLFERLGSLRLPKRLLAIQYRMHPSISCFSSKKFYAGQLLNGPSVIDGSDKKCYLSERIYSFYAFLNVSDGREVPSPDGENWINVVEAVVIAKILLKLFKAFEISGGKISIGVISPYKAQVQTIQEMLSGRIKANSKFSFWVRPWDEIESSEEDVIIISTVRCNDTGSIGLLSDRYLAEVSLTKARNFLWIVGNGPTLSTSHSIWQDLIFDAKDRECFFQVCEDKQIAGAVLNIKRELDELDDMLKQESALFCDTRWKILFSHDFKQSFVTLKTVFSKQVVLGFLLRMASGWLPKRGCLYFLSEFVKQYPVHGLYLVCTIDIVKDSQVLKVWDILPLVQTPMLLAKIEEMKSLCSVEYIKRCVMKKHEGNLVVPMIWKACSDFSKYKDVQNSQGHLDSFRSRNSLNDTRVGESLLLMKFYSLSSGIIKHMLTASDGKEIHLPFEVSDHESEIIQFPKTAFVLGRSGTGKTVVSMMKLVQREQQYFLALNGTVTESCSSHCYKGIKNYEVPVEGAGLRQLFVTVSPNLCSAVKNYITQLQRFAAGGEITRDINEVQMHEAGDYLCMFSDVPDTFIEIPQCHFPLVISLKKFLVMLDATVGSSYFDRFHDLKVIVGSKRSYLSHAAQQLIQSKEVSYERFVSKYWPKMNYKLTRKLDPLLVFTQIISYIKGGAGLCKVSHDNIMNEKDYVMLSGKKNSTIRKDKREMIYKIFLEYEKKKRTHQDYDISDLVIDLHRRLKLNQYEGPLVDFIYIDEVQDFTLNQLSLFKYICVNAEEGFHFSGDSAQAISKGIDFRFQDIRSLFYREFLGGSVRISDLFRLNHNFRTHSGILDLAQSVVELVYHFFPYSIDRLISEKSLVHGEVPVLLQLDSCSNEVLKTMCSVTETDGLSTFGAHQVILVRDEFAKREVIGQIGKSALILTVLECKGLEFHDVLLYNFFDRSPLQGQWGVIYDFKGCSDILGSLQKFPCFNEDIHSVLCSELKQLYVAITRTRQRFWIYEENWDAKPLFDYWMKLGVLQLKNFDASFVNSVKVFCTPQEWNNRGQQLFKVGNYESAASCFKRSGDEYRENLAKAACLQADGDRNLHLDNQLALKSLSKAAEIYEKIGKVESTVICLMKMGEYKRAGKIYLEKFHNPRYEDAADCFSLAGCWSDAAIYYAKASCLLKCMSICQKELRYEMGWGLINGTSGNLSKDDIVNYLKSWITHLIKILPIKSMVECVKEFPEDGYSFLHANENYIEVALLERVRGNTLCEASILERAKEYGKSLKLIVFCMAVQFFSSEKNDRPFELFEKQEKLAYKAKVLTLMVPSSIERYVSAEISFLSDRIGTSLDLLAQLKVAQKYENATVEFFAARQLLDAYLELPNDQFYDDLDDIFVNGNLHLKRLLFQGHVSVQIVIFAWNLWRQNIFNLFSFIRSIGSRNGGKYELCQDLCQKIFGVLRIDDLDVYVAINSRASWLKGKDEEGIYRSENIAYMNSRVYRLLAQEFLESEFCSVGMKILQKMKLFLDRLCGQKFFFIQRAVLALQLSGVLNAMNKCDGANNRGIFVVSSIDLNSAFFPLHYDKSMISAQNRGSLQDQETAVKAVCIILHENFKSLRVGSPAKIGWALIFLLLQSEFIGPMAWEVRSNSRSYTTWSKFYEKLLAYRTMGFRDASASAYAFLDALRHNGPQKQLLILECLVFLTASCQIGKGYFLTAKSTFSGSIFSQDSESIKYALSGGSPLCSDVTRSLCHQYDFILAVIREILSPRSRERRSQWAKESKLEDLKFHQLLVLRLVILLGLICLNSREHFHKVRKLLSDIGRVLSVLPNRFLLKLWGVTRGRKRTFKCFAYSFSKALEAVGNQLVVVRRGDDTGPSFMYLEPSFIDSGSISHFVKKIS